MWFVILFLIVILWNKSIIYIIEMRSYLWLIIAWKYSMTKSIIDLFFIWLTKMKDPLLHNMSSYQKRFLPYLIWLKWKSVLEMVIQGHEMRKRIIQIKKLLNEDYSKRRLVDGRMTYKYRCQKLVKMH